MTVYRLRRRWWWALGAALILLTFVALHYRDEASDAGTRLARAESTLSAERADSEARLARLEHILETERGRVAQYRRIVLYPRGAFEWCPSVAEALPVDRRTAREAGPVAVAFDLALHHRATATLTRLEDPTIALDTLVRTPRRAMLEPKHWAATELARGIQIVGSGPGFGMAGLVTYGCGRAVAARTWIVAVHDASNSNSAGSAAYFLVHRTIGWKVWGSY